MWTTMTHKELRAASKRSIVESIARYIADNLTKRDIIAWLMDAEKSYDKPAITMGPHGIVERIDVVRDIETNVIVLKRTMICTYYETGEVYDITISIQNAKDIETERWRTRHFKDVKSPIRTRIV